MFISVIPADAISVHTNYVISNEVRNLLLRKSRKLERSETQKREGKKQIPRHLPRNDKIWRLLEPSQ